MSMVELAGRYKLEAENSNGERRVLADWFDNLILNNGLDLLGQASAPLQRCVVGSGNTPAAASQVQLSNQIAATTTQQTVESGNDQVGGFTWCRITYRFAQGAATGNLNEVGVGVSNVSLFSRAVIVDGVGAPTTVTVLADEFLDVTYEFRLYWPTSDVTGVVVLDGANYNWTLRASNVGAWTNANLLSFSSFTNPYGSPTVNAHSGGTLGTISEPIQGGSSLAAVNSAAFDSYVAGDYELNFTCTFGLTTVTQSFDKLQLNFTFLGLYKMQFTPAIPKTNQDMVSFNFTISWARRSI